MATTRTTSVRGKRLLRIGGKTFARVRSRHPSHRILRRNSKLLFPFPVVIRLGSTTEGVRPGSIELNTIRAVRNCSDKMRMKTIFRDSKIQSPRYWTLEEMRKEKDVKFPIVKKIRFRSRGHGMVLIEDQKQLNDQLKRNSGDNNVYFEQFFDGCREYRLHISPLGCFYTCRKVRKKDAKERWFFNSSNSNWLLETNPSFNRPTTWKAIVSECQKGLKALGLDFAAFDVRVKKDGSFVILEANSAPSFGDTPNTSVVAQKYLEHLPLIVKQKQKK